MNRKLWGGVVLTTAVLASSGAVARVAAVSTNEWLQTWTGQAAMAAKAAARETVAAATDLGARASAELAVTAALAALAIVSFAAAWWLARAARFGTEVRWREALGLARRGLPIGRIARRTRLAQDAVRALTRPGPALARRRVS